MSDVGPGPETSGETIGPYRLGRRLGAGGMGVVFEAHDPSLDRRVALKLISPQLAADPGFRARFTREAHAQASLDSPHVVAVHAHGEADGHLYIATQLIPDGDLGALLQRDGPPPLPVALDLVAQVASGLADAHAAGLVHRDIKPANVLLRRRPAGSDTTLQAYLADFGIARLVSGDHTTVHALGTVAYMAPELHTGAAASQLTDVYSLGCLLWATLTGTPPYAGSTDYQVAQAHLEHPVPQLEAGSPRAAEVDEVLRRAMAKDPAERYPSASALRAALRRVAGPPSAPPPRIAPLPVEAGGRRTAPLLAAVVVVVVLGVLAGGAWWSGRDDDPVATGPRLTSSPAPTTSAPTGSPTSPPSPSASPSESDPSPSTSAGSGASAADEDRAAASMSTALTGGLGVSATQADCVARSTIDQVGLDQLVAIGFFTADLDYVPDLELGPHPDVKSALTTATLTCVTVG